MVMLETLQRLTNTIDGTRGVASICHLYQTPGAGGQTLTNSSNNSITFGAGTELYDPLGWHSTTTNTAHITIGTAGLYFVYGHIQTNDDGNEAIRIVSITKNASKVVDSRGGVDGSGRWAMTTFTAVNCAVNDYLELYCYFGGTTNGVAYQSALGLFKI